LTDTWMIGAAGDRAARRALFSDGRWWSRVASGRARDRASDRQHRDHDEGAASPHSLSLSQVAQ
jgi:hypothetical protein